MLSRRATVRSHVVTAEPAPQLFPGFLLFPREVPRGNAHNPRKEPFPHFQHGIDALPLLPATAPQLFPGFLLFPREVPRGNAHNPRKEPFPHFLHGADAPPPLPATARRLHAHITTDCTAPQEVSEPNCFQHTESVIYRAFRSVRDLRLTVSSVAERKACGNHSLDPPQSEVGGDRGHGREGSRRDPVG